jgi:hypothetical protein
MRQAPSAQGPGCRIAVLCSTAWGIRNFVLSGVLDDLRRDCEVQLLSASTANNALAEPCDAGATLPLLQATAPCHDTLGMITEAAFMHRAKLRSSRLFARFSARAQPVSRWLTQSAVAGAATIVARNPMFEWASALERKRALRRPGMEAIRRQLRSLAPDLVISTACVVPDEAAYVRVANELGLPTLGCILSFDNLTSRGRLPAFQHYAVWSRRMRDEVLRLYPQCRVDQVHVTGTPQFDLHRQAQLHWNRPDTLVHLGLPPDARYLLYAANCAAFTPTEPLLVHELARRLAAVPVLGRHVVVVRLHPADDPARWRGLDTDAPLIVSHPRDDDGRFGTPHAQLKLVSSVAHADVCINMASTMSLDAAVLDRPVACAGFALPPGSPEDSFAAACHATAHYLPVVESGGVRLARSLEDLLSICARYVVEPGLDSAGRRTLVAEVCGPVDGLAGARVTGLIRELVAAEPAKIIPSPHRSRRGKRLQDTV